MASFDLLAVVSGRPTRTPTSTSTFDFSSVKIGASGMEIKETSGTFDFSAKKLVNLAQGTAPGHAVVLDSNSQIPFTMMPPAAVERLVIVADQTARFLLTTATVQNGDTVKQTDTSIMYFVIDDTNLGNAGGYSVYTAGTASSVAWTGITGKPTTLTGYGVSDADVVDSVIAAFVSGAGTVASTDTLTGAINKLDGNTALKLNTSAFTDAAVTGKLITGFVSGAGAVAATDTILQAINKLDGNTAAKLNTSAFTDAAVTGKLITGFVSGAGAVAATDTILQAINKLDGNTAAKLNTSAFTDAAVTGKLITGFVSGAGTVAATDTILQAINKLDGNVAAVAGGASSTKSLTNDNAGTITVNQVVLVKANGHVDLAIASTANLDTFHIGIVKDATILTTAAGNIYVVDGRLISGFTGLTPGAKVYVSRGTAGALTQSLAGFVTGEFVYCVGRAVSATEIAYDPEFEFQY